MIKNPKYKGYYCAKKSEVVNYMSKTVKKIDKSDWVIYKDNVKIPPIVTEELWNLANRRLEEKNSLVEYYVKKNDLVLKYNYFKGIMN